jgi:hypothetical protein
MPKGIYQHKPFTVEHCKNIGNQKNALGCHWHQTEEVKRKIGDAERGEKHWNWQGGKSFVVYPIEWTASLRKEIRERDNYLCQNCGKFGNNIHHIDYNKKNCNFTNLINLCISCNVKANYNREYWKYYYNIKILEKYAT